MEVTNHLELIKSLERESLEEFLKVSKHEWNANSNIKTMSPAKGLLMISHSNLKAN